MNSPNTATIVSQDNIVMHDPKPHPNLELTDHHWLPIQSYQDQPGTFFDLFAGNFPHRNGSIKSANICGVHDSVACSML